MPRFHVTPFFDRLGRWSAVALGFCIPISVAFDNFLLAVMLACLLLRGNLRDPLAFLRQHPYLLVSVAFFGLLVLGTLYGPTPAYSARQYLMKYSELLLVPVMAWFLRDAATSRKSLYAFCCAIALTVLLSFAMHLGFKSYLLLYDPVYSVPFKHSLTHSILVAFGAFVFGQLALSAASMPVRLAWLALAALAVVNVIFVVPGRTGFVILGVLALYTGFARWRWAGLARMLVVGLLVLAAAYATSERFQDRIVRAFEEYASRRSDTPAGSASAVGLRIEFYRNSIAIVRDHPLFGVGTGGFAAAYAEKVAGTGMTPTVNPHNEYLLITVQLGMIGTLAFIAMLCTLWKGAAGLGSRERHLARGIVLAIAVGCVFNSLLMDHVEGLLFTWLTALLYSGSQAAEPRVAGPTMGANR